jgi:hypothetical protein
MIRYSTLRDRYLSDTAPGGSGASPGITRALEHVGWRSVGDPSAEVLAGHLVLMFDSCVHLHRDVQALAYAIASVMRDAGPLLDGGLPPVEAYLPAADEVLRRYVESPSADAPPPFGALDWHR